MGVGPFSSESSVSQVTRQIDKSQTVSDYGVATSYERSGNVRLGKNATLIQYIMGRLTPDSVTPLPFTDPTTDAVKSRRDDQTVNEPARSHERSTGWILFGAMALLLAGLGIAAFAKRKGT
jgi:hypothetical protein